MRFARHSTRPLDSALSFPDSLQGDFHILIALQAGELRSPLYQQDAVGREQIVKAERFQVALGIDAVKVNVVERGEGSAVFVDEGKGRAGHILSARGSEAFRDPLDEGCLARSEVTAQQHDERRR